MPPAGAIDCVEYAVEAQRAKRDFARLVRLEHAHGLCARDLLQLGEVVRHDRLAVAPERECRAVAARGRRAEHRESDGERDA